MEEFQQMIQERRSKVEEIQNCLNLSAVRLALLFFFFFGGGVIPSLFF